MILKMQCGIQWPSWHYVDHIEDLHSDVFQKKGEVGKEPDEDEVQSLDRILSTQSDYITRVIKIS